MSREEISVRQWQEQFKAGTFDSPDIFTPNAQRAGTTGSARITPWPDG